jgi:hypothetical protein
MANDRTNVGGNDYGWQLLLRLGCPLPQLLLARIYSFQRKGLQCWLSPTQLAIDVLPGLASKDRREATRQVSKALTRLATSGKILRAPGVDDRYGTKTDTLTVSPELFLKLQGDERAQAEQVLQANTEPDETVVQIVETAAPEPLLRLVPARTARDIAASAKEALRDTLRELLEVYLDLYPQSLAYAVGEQTMTSMLTDAWSTDSNVLLLQKDAASSGSDFLTHQLRLNVIKLLESVDVSQAREDKQPHYMSRVVRNAFTLFGGNDVRTAKAFANEMYERKKALAADEEARAARSAAKVAEAAEKRAAVAASSSTDFIQQRIARMQVVAGLR